MKLLQNQDLPEWFNYPEEFLVLINQNLIDFSPWIVILDSSILRIRYSGLKERYPNRLLVPFARREDNDDVACWEKDKGVVIIHDFASNGFEGGETGITFWDWLRFVISEMIDFNS